MLVELPKRKTGKIKFFNGMRGFGFIKPDDGSADVFLSINELPSGLNSLYPDTKCSFLPIPRRQGLYAKDLQLL